MYRRSGRLLRALQANTRPYGGLSNLVRRIANRGIEVKHVGTNTVNADFNSTISAAAECYPLMPTVSEGTDGHNRIGDKVKPKYLLVKGKLHYSSSVQGTYLPPSTVRIMILTQKNVKTRAQVGTVDTDHLLKDNIGTDVGRAYTGSSFDNLAPINKDLFHVYMDRKVKMRAQIEKQLGDNNTVLGYATQRTYTFTKKIKCPASLTFDDGNGDTPNNFCPFICLGGVNDDSSTPWTLTTPYHLTVQSELYFVDP